MFNLDDIVPINPKKYPCYICSQPSSGCIGSRAREQVERQLWVCSNCYYKVIFIKNPTVEQSKRWREKPFRAAFTPDESGYYYLDNGMYYGLALVDIETRTVLLKHETEVFSLDDEIIRNHFYGARYDNLPDAVPVLDSGRLVGFPKLVP